MRNLKHKMKSRRREFFKLAGIVGISITGASIIPAHAIIASEPDPALIPESNMALTPLNRFPRMVQEYFVSRVRQVEQSANNRRSELQTKSDAKVYVSEVPKKIQQCLGPWPEKTPLNAKVTRKYDRETYTIENVIFESRPEFQVTANLYIPKGHKFPRPVVIGACGHDDSGKVANQSFSGLAQLGCIVLVFDPIGQGERIQYLTSKLKPRHGIGVNEHIYLGNQMIIT